LLLLLADPKMEKSRQQAKSVSCGTQRHQQRLGRRLPGEPGKADAHHVTPAAAAAASASPAATPVLNHPLRPPRSQKRQCTCLPLAAQSGDELTMAPPPMPIMPKGSRKKGSRKKGSSSKGSRPIISCMRLRCRLIAPRFSLALALVEHREVPQPLP